MLSKCNLSFRIVEQDEFRDFLRYLNADIDTWLPKNHCTIKEYVIRQYKGQKRRIKTQIGKAQSKIHISCDLWTSGNSMAILGVIAHFITEDGDLRYYLLAMKILPAGHGGEDQAPFIMDVINDYGFANKLGFFVMDNADSNDKMMRFLALGEFLATV
jgi:hypothetical protein